MAYFMFVVQKGRSISVAIPDRIYTYVYMYM